ncbi:phosphatidylethanolamine N-methyltransferase [[Candida] railenensis]|uniref:Phosphatidylethanolamine N-methyltransferase n=1 Tax=[Candida] railenensis TaxID=45579 RepID=A0A9P0QVL2_9ASCO|nr:phosphatidylethanolamine N-methyltransferase [[Candida] railenensis]
MTATKTKNTIAGSKGITFSGDTFVVPETYDMVKTLFDVSIRKSNCEKIIVALLASNALVFWLVDSNSARVKIFICLYLFWRFSYNFGIGFLLNQQSNHQRLVKWTQNGKIFESKTSTLGKFCQAEIKSQMGEKYDISAYPDEFNTWLLFRKVVDLILMSDFTTFICLVVSCSIDKDYQFINIQQQSLWIVVSRFVIGVSFILFNLWVKVNAHNTIKDYAWYWGDFFFRQINNEELIFDGVFEMFPHPMYSVGYIGYYGFALISKSYTVLVVSLFGHFLQMIFLHYIENPHIDKIYGMEENADLEQLLKLKDLKHFDNLKPLVGLFNLNWLRSTDLVSLILSVTYGLLIPLFVSASTINENGNTGRSFILGLFKSENRFFTPSNILFGLTVSIKMFESVSINTLLILQSYYKTFTKFCISNDIPVEKSLNNFATFYNSLILLTYSSFFGLNFFFYFNGVDLYFQDYLYLRIFVGVLLIFTQFWINSSIIDQIGYFGWFYGDFFIPRSLALPQRGSQLTKAGIYRYLNNPEQIFGVCGIFGVTLICPCFENVAACVLWVGNNFFRINFIEKLHMIKVYGEQEVMKDSGVTKTIKKHLIPDVLQRRDQKSNLRRKSSITNSLDHFIKELRSKNSKLSNKKILELSQGLYFENSEYKIKVVNLIDNIDEINSFKYINIGEPIQIEWNSPVKEEIEGDKKGDWIGLYRVSQTSYSRNKTLISSSGKWIWCTGKSGSGFFSEEKLFWEEGVYEFRYHLEGKHDVAYISEPFEIKSINIDVTATTTPEALAADLKSHVFDKILTKRSIPSIDASINDSVIEEFIKTYDRLALMISLATDIKINSKIFFNDDNQLTIHKLSDKLIKIKRVLDELSYNSNSIITIEKKDI